MKPIPPSKVTHWRRHGECVVETYNTYSEDETTITGMGAHAVNATACGRLASHNDTTGDPTEADCPECVLVHKLLRMADGEAEVFKTAAAWKGVFGTSE